MLSEDNLHIGEEYRFNDLMTFDLSSRDRALMYIGGYFATPS
jgi:hypothetical protein